MSSNPTFIGGKALFLLFAIQFHSLFHVVESHMDDVGDGPLQYPANPATEVAFIGLVAHFEAYCKPDFWADSGNIAYRQP